jgi:hypothetical protein
LITRSRYSICCKSSLVIYSDRRSKISIAILQTPITQKNNYNLSKRNYGHK